MFNQLTSNFQQLLLNCEREQLEKVCNKISNTLLACSWIISSIMLTSTILLTLGKMPPTIFLILGASTIAFYFPLVFFNHVWVNLAHKHQISAPNLMDLFTSQSMPMHIHMFKVIIECQECLRKQAQVASPMPEFPSSLDVIYCSESSPEKIATTRVRKPIKVEHIIATKNGSAKIVDDPYDIFERIKP